MFTGLLENLLLNNLDHRTKARNVRKLMRARQMLRRDIELLPELAMVPSRIMRMRLVRLVPTHTFEIF